MMGNLKSHNTKIVTGACLSSAQALTTMQNGEFSAIPHYDDPRRFRVWKLVSGKFWYWHINNAKWRDDGHTMTENAMWGLDWRTVKDGPMFSKGYPSKDHEIQAGEGK